MTVDENSGTNTVVGPVVPTDPEGDTLTYTLSTPFSGYFSVNSAGTIYVDLCSTCKLDYEGQGR